MRFSAPGGDGTTSEETFTDRNYIENILVKNCGFKKAGGLSGEMDRPCLLIPSPKEAILFSMYSHTEFLYDKQTKLRIEHLMPHLTSQLMTKEPIKLYPWERTALGIPVHPLKPSMGELRSAVPQIFEGEKILVLTTSPLTGDSKSTRYKYRKEYEELLNRIELSGRSFTDFLLLELSLPQHLEHTKEREFYVTELLFEYFAGSVLRDKGYLVTAPLATFADIVAFRSPELIGELRDKKNLERGGFLAELALHEVFGDVEPTAMEIPEVEEAVVVEAESTQGRTSSWSDREGFGQAQKHLALSGVNYNRAFATGPLCFKTHEEVGTISFDKDGELFFNEGHLEPTDVGSTLRYVKQVIENLVK